MERSHLAAVSCHLVLSSGLAPVSGDTRHLHVFFAHALIKCTQHRLRQTHLSKHKPSVRVVWLFLEALVAVMNGLLILSGLLERH